MPAALDEAKATLVRRWGEMGGYWGINRTMAEIHALLFISTQPLCTDDVMAQLHISRGNASMNLRSLVDWGLVQRIHQLGDRREYFQADTDVWHMFGTIMRERRRREVEPIIATLQRCRELVDAPARGDVAVCAELDEVRRRLDSLQNFLTTMGTLFELVLNFGESGIGKLASLVATGRGGPVAARSAPAAKSQRQKRGPHR